MASDKLETGDQGQFAKQWKSSDLVLSVEDRKFHVHRTLLAVASPVFEAMFSSDFKEKTASEVPLPSKKAGDIEELLKFIYPGQVHTLTRLNCLSLLKLANEYQMERLVEECNNFIFDWCTKGEMMADTAIRIVVFSQKYPVDEKTVDRCLGIFSTREDLSWDDMKRHRWFAAMTPETVYRLMEKRIEYFEDELDVWKPMNNFSSPAKRYKRR